MKVRKKSKLDSGITLVALVITVIILLILAGITIASLQNSGLFQKIQVAAEKSKLAIYYEDIKMDIMEVQVEFAGKSSKNTKLSRAVTSRAGETRGEKTPSIFIEALRTTIDKNRKNDWLSNIEMYKDINGEEDKSATASECNRLRVQSKDGFEIIINVDNEKREAVIDEELSGKVNYDAKIVYNKNAEDATGTMDEQPAIMGRKSKLKPSEFTRNEYVWVGWSLTQNGEVIQEDVLKINNETTELYAQWLDVNSIKESKPTINSSSTGGAYPIITEYGIESGKNIVTISYIDSQYLKHLYSEDGGTTWKEYKGEIITSSQTIKAKSVLKDDESISTQIQTTNLNTQLASDALKIAAYDKNENTYDSTNNGHRKIKVDSSMIGKRIYIHCYAHCWPRDDTYSSINFYSSNNTLISQKKYWDWANDNFDDKLYFTIPDGTDYISFFSSTHTDYYIRAYEIQATE